MAIFTGSGSAAAPSITFSADTNTGVFSPGADQLAISTNSTERVEFGTSEVVFNDGGENYDFRIEGDTDTNLFFVDASTDRVWIGDPTTFATQTKFSVSDTAAVYSKLLWNNSNTDSGQIERGGYLIETRNAAGTSNAWGLYGYTENLDNNFNAGLTLKTVLGGTASERLRIDSSGRVGIGTSSPARALEVNAQNGTNNTSVPALRLKTGNIAGAAGYGTGIDFTVQASNNVEFVSARIESTYTDITNQSGDVRISTMNAVSFSEKLRITSTGDALIGGTLPSAPNLTLSAGGTITAVSAIRGSRFTTASTFSTFTSNQSISLTVPAEEHTFYLVSLSGYTGAGTGSVALRLVVLSNNGTVISNTAIVGTVPTGGTFTAGTTMTYANDGTLRTIHMSITRIS